MMNFFKKQPTETPEKVTAIKSNSGTIGEISVSDPKRIADPRISLTPHTSYSIRDANYGPNVERRYSDFVWLVEKIESQFPGIIIPPLPPKNSLGRFEDTLIESRRVALERFINRVVRHKKIGKCADVETFVRANEETFHILRKDTTTKLFTNTASSAASWLGHVIANNTVHHTPEESPKTATDILFEDMLEFIEKILKHAKEVNKNIIEFVNASADQCIYMREIADAMVKLENIEDDAVLSAYLSDTSVGFKKLSDNFETYTNGKLQDLQYPFEEHVGYLESVQKALKRRAELRRKFDHCKEQVVVTNAKLLGSSVDAQKEYERRVELRIALEEEKSTTSLLMAVTEDLLYEYNQFKETRLVEMANIIVNFSNTQVKFCRDAETNSKSLAARILLSTPTSYAPKNLLPPVPPSTTTRDNRNMNNNANNNMYTRPAIMTETDDVDTSNPFGYK